MPPAHAQHPPEGAHGLAAGQATPGGSARAALVLAGRGGTGHPKKEGRERVDGRDGV